MADMPGSPESAPLPLFDLPPSREERQEHRNVDTLGSAGLSCDVGQIAILLATHCEPVTPRSASTCAGFYSSVIGNSGGKALIGGGRAHEFRETAFAYRGAVVTTALPGSSAAIEAPKYGVFNTPSGGGAISSDA